MEKTPNVGSPEGALRTIVAFPWGISLICLGSFFCTVEISLFSCLWVVMRIHSVILKIFVEVYGVLDIVERQGIGR